MSGSGKEELDWERCVGVRVGDSSGREGVGFGVGDRCVRE